MKGIRMDPAQTDNKSQALYEIRQSKIIDQYNVLVVPDITTVVLFPKEKAVGDEKY